jgi:Ni,Fe-hydrogenase I small subunit
MKWMTDAFLDSYEGQSTEELLALEREYRVDSLVLAFEQAIQNKSPDSISTEESYVLAVEGLEREVNNGGYSQFSAIRLASSRRSSKPHFGPSSVRRLLTSPGTPSRHCVSAL